MFCYEVNLEVQKGISDKYADWLPGHIREVVELGSFLGADWWSRESDSASEVFWTIRYYAKERDTVSHYVEKHAPKLRQAALDLFGAQFKADRKVYQLNEIF